MKYSLAAFALLLSFAAAPASLAAGLESKPMPSGALTHGQNADGCYYFSAKKEHVYTKGFTLVVPAGASCDREAHIAQYDAYGSSAIGKRQLAVTAYLKSLLK
jgi:hypothetical protein